MKRNSNRSSLPNEADRPDAGAVCLSDGELLSVSGGEGTAFSCPFCGLTVAPSQFGAHYNQCLNRINRLQPAVDSANGRQGGWLKRAISEPTASPDVTGRASDRESTGAREASDGSLLSY